MPRVPNVALVYDWVTTTHGGAEKVLLALHEAFPTAPLYTAVYDAQAATWANGFDVRTSFIQRLPGAKKWYRWLSWLMPLAFESFDFSRYDVVISVTSAEAKGILTKPSQLHLCYLLTPTRYLYSHEHEYVSQQPWVLRPLISLFLSYLKWWDLVAAHRPDRIIPISRLVAQRVQDYYNLKTEQPLYPPVTLAHRQSSRPSTYLPAHYFLIVSRLVHYKHVDLAIQACQNLNQPLVIVGQGPLKTQLKKLVTKPHLVQFLSQQSDAQVADLLSHSQGLLMPGIEDFGITAMEAVLAGKPVLVHQASGVAELLSNGSDGIFISELSLLAVQKGVKELQQLKYESKDLTQKAQKYATTTFVQKFSDMVLTTWQKGIKEGSYEYQ